LTYWVGYLWLMAHRGKISGDPVLFAFKDGVSRWTIAIIGICVALAL
jgi:hypothetical protein